MSTYLGKNRDKTNPKIKTGTLGTIYRSLKDRRGRGVTSEESRAMFYFEQANNQTADGQMVKALDSFEEAEKILIDLGYQIT